MSERTEAARPWLASRWHRLNGPQRLAGIDLARGLAVLGMLSAHLADVPDIVWTDTATWWGIVHGRSSILFATLAGVSIGIVTGGIHPFTGTAMATARGRIAVRAGLIWVLGLFLIATGVPVYVILPAYGILFLLAIPFTGFGAGALFAIAAALGLVMPFVQAWIGSGDVWATPAGSDLLLLVGGHYPFTVWIAFVLAGLGAARAGLQRLRVQIALLTVGGALAVIGYGSDAAAALPVGAPSVWHAVWTAAPHSSGLLEVVGSGGFALAAIGACLLVCRTVLVWVVLPLRAVGAMPLTVYAGQIFAWWIIALVVLGDPGDLAGMRVLDPLPSFVVVTIVACTAWALLVGRGPLEWLVDRTARLVVSGPRPR